MIMGAFGTATTTFSGRISVRRNTTGSGAVCVWCGLMAFGAAALISTVVLVFGPLIFRIFTSDEGVIESGMQIIHALAPFYFTYVCVEVISGHGARRGRFLLADDHHLLRRVRGKILWILFVVPQYHTIENRYTYRLSDLLGADERAFHHLLFAGRLAAPQHPQGRLCTGAAQTEKRGA